MSEIPKKFDRRTAIFGAWRLAAGVALAAACGTGNDNNVDTAPGLLQAEANALPATPDFRTEAGTKIVTPTPNSTFEADAITPVSEPLQTETPVFTSTPDFRTPTPNPTSTVEAETPAPVPVAVSKEEVSAPPPAPENFPWSREEIVFSPNAGFQKLREGGQVAVYIDPELSDRLSEAAIAPWNNLGVDLRGKPYAILTSDLLTADIRFVPAEATWVQPVNASGVTDYKNPFHIVNIHCAPAIDNATAAHEAGHALFGFVDFLTSSQYQNPEVRKRYQNPQNGGDSQKPYVGVMNYVYWSQHDVWFGKDDRSLLRLGGYA